MKFLFITVLGSCLPLALLRCAAQTASTTAPEDYGFTWRDPVGCTAGVNCEYFVGIQYNQDNASYLDFHLEGLPNWGGWVAIGFSASRSMVSVIE